MATLRLFIAIEIPPEVKSQFATVLRELKAAPVDVRWEALEKLHVTLKFLGDTNPELLPQVIQQLDRVVESVHPFAVRYSGLGCFPNARDPKILWVGAEDVQHSMIPLVESIEKTMAALGLKREAKPFHAHVTIGRVKSQRNIQDLLRIMESTTLKSHTTNVSHIVLVKSELKPSGSEYSIIKAFQFSATQNLNH